MSFYIAVVHFCFLHCPRRSLLRFIIIVEYRDVRATTKAAQRRDSRWLNEEDRVNFLPRRETEIAFRAFYPKIQRDRYLPVCVFFTLNRSFYRSTSSTTSVRADSSVLEEIPGTSYLVTNLPVHRRRNLQNLWYEYVQQYVRIYIAIASSRNEGRITTKTTSDPHPFKRESIHAVPYTIYEYSSPS